METVYNLGKTAKQNLTCQKVEYRRLQEMSEILKILLRVIVL